MKARLLIFAAWVLVLFVGATARMQAQFTYTIHNGAVTITGHTGPDADLVIPDFIAGLPVVSIGDWAFAGSSSLSSVSIPAGVTNIGRGAFEECISLIDITIPENVTRLGDWAFAGCTSLANLIIPAGVMDIGWYAFRNCTSLTLLEVDAANPAYSSRDGVVFNRIQTELILCPPGKAGNYAIPDGTAQVGGWAFSGCTGLTSITIPDSVSTIAPWAFEGCSSLASVTLPGRVTSIKGGVFSGCTGLVSVRIGNGITSIGKLAFEGCTGLTSITIPRSVSLIDGGWGLGADTSMGAFRGCTSLTGVFFQGDPPRDGGWVFDSADQVTVYHQPGTTGWDSTFGGRPAVLWNPLLHARGPQADGFQLEVTGTPEIPIVVEAGTALFGCHWVPLHSGVLTGGARQVTDSNWVNHPARFHRVRSP